MTGGHTPFFVMPAHAGIQIFVMPAQAGIQGRWIGHWVPACAGMTGENAGMTGGGTGMTRPWVMAVR